MRFGGAPIGNLYAPVADEVAAATLAAAVRAGVTSVDTAPLYGHGLSERRIGSFLAERPGTLAVTTKVGRRVDAAAGPGAADGFVDVPPSAVSFDYSRDGILHSFDASLRRLGVERVDTLLLHDIGRLTHTADHSTVMRRVRDEALPTMRRLCDEGRVGRIGIGVNETEVVTELLAVERIDIVLVAGRYTLLDRSARRLFDACRTRGVAVLAAGVFNSGLLAGGDTLDYRPAPAAEIGRRDALASVARDHDVALPAAALAFALAHPAVEQIVVGFRSPEEVAAAEQWLQTPVPVSFWHELIARGLLEADALLPC